MAVVGHRKFQSIFVINYYPFIYAYITLIFLVNDSHSRVHNWNTSLFFSTGIILRPNHPLRISCDSHLFNSFPFSISLSIKFYLTPSASSAISSNFIHTRYSLQFLILGNLVIFSIHIYFSFLYSIVLIFIEIFTTVNV